LTCLILYVIIFLKLINLSKSHYPLNQPRFPLRINIGFLLHQSIGSSRDIHFDLPELHLPPDLELCGLAGSVRIGRTPQGLVVVGDFQAGSKMECVRCLVEFQQPLHTQFSELYSFNSVKSIAQVHAASEMGLIVPEDGNIDLAPLVREYMLLEIPIRPLCKPDCKGLCIICGADLNTEPCEHQKGIRI
jgi:uncharacterized protein